VILTAAVLIAGHMLFWKLPVPLFQKLTFVTPVLLCVLFVIHIAMEFWCKMVIGTASAYNAAQLKGLRGNFMLVRIGYLLAIATAVLKLIGIYDAGNILKVLLSILFVYETVFLLFTLAVRAIRKELRTQPEVLVSIIGAGSDTNILRYLEDNTGITMRSLWSLQLVKKVLPVAVMGVALTVWLSTCVVQIEAHQQGALFRMGKLQPKPLQPGMHLTLPWPLDRTEVYDTDSVKKVTIGYSREENMDNYWTKGHGGEEFRLLLGGGEEVASINLVVQYRIGDLMQYIKGSAAPESILQAQAYEIVTERTISTDLDSLLAEDREAFSESFAEELSERMQSCGTGLQIVDVVLESIHPPVEIAYVYQNIISAGIEAEYLILMSETRAIETVRRAEKDAVKTVSDAQVRQLEGVASAKASVAEFLASVEADGTYADSYRYQKYIQAIAAAYGDAKIIIVGEGVDGGNIYLGSVPVGTIVP
jgi:regulator of protease activity HflC (stomatin/prohibitin superfamily)